MGLAGLEPAALPSRDSVNACQGGNRREEGLAQGSADGDDDGDLAIRKQDDPLCVQEPQWLWEEAGAALPGAGSLTRQAAGSSGSDLIQVLCWSQSMAWRPNR